MRNIFYPHRQKLLTTGVILGVIITSLALRTIPVEIDILDLREVPEFVVFIFGRVPIEIFDFLTGEAFAPRGEGFLVFPTLPQSGFALLFDLGVIYLASCLKWEVTFGSFRPIQQIDGDSNLAERGAIDEDSAT